MPTLEDERPWRLADLTSDAVRALSKDDAVVVLPLGAVEQHGPHLPCNVDGILVEAILRGALRRLPVDASVWALPLVAYGTSSEHLGFPGTVSLSTGTLSALLCDICRSLERSGFRKLVLLNGHGGQVHLLEVAARDVRVDTGLLVFPVFPYRAGLPQGLVLPNGAPPDVHAGWIETSMMLAVAPQLVRESAAARDGERASAAYQHSERLSLEGAFPTAWVTADVSANGTVGDPRGASAEAGARIIDHLAGELAVVLVDACRFAF